MENTEAPVNPKTAWYRAHKSPELRAKMNESRRAYYRRNVELEKARALARYYARKEAMIGAKLALAQEVETPDV